LGFSTCAGGHDALLSESWIEKPAWASTSAG